jgi:hypothetical protein
VEIQELKETLAQLMLSDLEMLGLSIDDIDAEDAIQLYATADDYCQERNEATWISAVNNDDLSFVGITQGTLYDEEAIEETGREIEVGRIFIDENKAEMLVDALFHAFPEKIYERVSASIDDEKEDQEINLDAKIGDLKKDIDLVDRLRRKHQNKIKNSIDSDDCIDVYEKIKTYAGKLKDAEAEPEVVKRKNTVLFVSGFKDRKVIKLTEANVGEIVREQTQDLAAKRISKTILIDRKLARALANAVTQTFK